VKAANTGVAVEYLWEGQELAFESLPPKLISQFKLTTKKIIIEQRRKKQRNRSSNVENTKRMVQSEQPIPQDPSPPNPAANSSGFAAPTWEYAWNAAEKQYHAAMV
jgi:hypothetical protein